METIGAVRRILTEGWIRQKRRKSMLRDKYQDGWLDVSLTNVGPMRMARFGGFPSWTGGPIDWICAASHGGRIWGGGKDGHWWVASVDCYKKPSQELGGRGGGSPSVWKRPRGSSWEQLMEYYTWFLEHMLCKKVYDCWLYVNGIWEGAEEGLVLCVLWFVVCQDLSDLLLFCILVLAKGPKV